MKVVTKENFENVVLKSDKPVIVDFYADWCGPCKALTPVLEKLAEENKNTYNVVKVDVDASPEMAEKFHIRSMPTLLVIRGGNVIAKQSGARSKSELSSWMDEALALPEDHVLDIGPKPVNLTEEQKRNIIEGYREMLAVRPDHASNPSPKEGLATYGDYIEDMIESGELISWAEKSIGFGDRTYEGIFDYLDKLKNPVSLTEEQKNTLVAEIRKYLDASPEKANAPATRDGSLSMREAFEKSVHSGSYFTQIVDGISLGKTTYDKIIEHYKAEQQKPSTPSV